VKLNFVLPMVALALPCSCPRPASRVTAPPDTSTTPAAASPAERSSGDSQDGVITIDVGPCYGPCAVYSLTFRATGDVEYEGSAYVGAHGHQRTRINPEQFSSLIKMFDAAQFEQMTWPHNCPDKFTTDHSTIRTSISRSGRTHTLEHNLGDGCAPQKLVDLEKAILAAPGPVVHAWTTCDASFCSP
jgi:hypothetical protein